MNVYLDASVIVPLFVPDPFTAKADALIREILPVVFISDLAAAELASAVARRVRTGESTAIEAHSVFSDFDRWSRPHLRVQIGTADIALAATFLRRLDLPLRTIDAIHIAAARRLGTTLATFDKQMSASATALGVMVAGE